MVQHRYPEQTPCLDQAVGQLHILGAGGWIAGGMVVCYDHRRSTPRDRFPECFPGMNETHIQGAYGDLNDLQQPVARIQEKDDEVFLLPMNQMPSRDFDRRLGRFNGVAGFRWDNGFGPAT